jgi:maleate cis-trans isomerase
MTAPTKTAEPGVAMKVGLMVPANNTTMERELAAWLPEGSSVTTMKIPRGEGLLTRDTIPAYRDRAIALACEHFSHGEVELLAYGCTAAGFLSGPAGDAELARQLAEATSLPVVTTARAMVNALQHDRASKVVVVTPYGEEVNRQLSAFLDSADIGVVRLASLNAPDVTALGRITAEEVRDLARKTMGSDCDALFIGCSQLPTYAILADLTAEFGRPAWSSISATGTPRVSQCRPDVHVSVEKLAQLDRRLPRQGLPRQCLARATPGRRPRSRGAPARYSTNITRRTAGTPSGSPSTRWAPAGSCSTVACCPAQSRVRSTTWPFGNSSAS